jgi:DNA-binding response OmpR family regulator
MRRGGLSWVKPFDLPELQARVRALLRRQEARNAHELRIGALRLRLGAPRVTLGESTVDLLRCRGGRSKPP